MPGVFNMVVLRNNPQKLFLIKLVHAALFVFFSSCLAYVFYSGITRTYDWILFLAVGTILIESLVLLLNKWQCPLTDLAKKYGDEHGRVTDMFFPAWFVPHVLRSCAVLIIMGVATLVAGYVIGRV
jgi:hypothetical protein